VIKAARHEEITPIEELDCQTSKPWVEMSVAYFKKHPKESCL
jgi:hypothetical protein